MNPEKDPAAHSTYQHWHNNGAVGRILVEAESWQGDKLHSGYQTLTILNHDLDLKPQDNVGDITLSVWSNFPAV